MTAAQTLAIAAPRPPFRPAAGLEVEELADELSRITVRIHTRGARYDGVGAGVLWRRGGRSLVVTNAHVVPPRRGDDPTVENRAGSVVAARVIARDRERDLALLSLAEVPNDWPALASLGASRSLRTGELVVALGHPFGLPGALSVGVLHAVPRRNDRWLQADIRLAPGNSGGPLATVDGMVIGINAMIVRGLGIAVPAAAVAAFAERVLETSDEDGA